MTLTTALITGANRGIGFELVNQHLKQGYHVIATCRAPEKAEGLNELKQAGMSLDILPMDVSDNNQIFSLVENVTSHAIDRLILCAGLYGQQHDDLSQPPQQALQDVFQVNAIAPLMLANQLIDPVKRSKEKLIVGITSKMGSIADNESGGAYFYRGSKAALNAMLFSLSRDTASSGIRTLILHPGWVQTAMGGPNALITVETSVSGMMTVMHKAHQYDNGAFLSFDGTTIPW